MTADAPVKWTARLVAVIPPGCPPPPQSLQDIDVELNSPEEVVQFVSMGLQVSGFGPEGMVRQYEQAIKEMEAEGVNDRVDRFDLDLREKFNLIPMPGSNFDQFIDAHPGMEVRVEVTPVYAMEEITPEVAEKFVSDIEELLMGDSWKDV